MTTAEFREQLGREAKGLTDEQLEELRQDLYSMARLLVEMAREEHREVARREGAHLLPRFA